MYSVNNDCAVCKDWGEGKDRLFMSLLRDHQLAEHSWNTECRKRYRRREVLAA